MEPGFSSYKLMVALKYPNEDECYPYAVEHFMGSYVKSLDTVGKNPDMIIPKGTHIVRVQLRGVNVTDEFEFEFINPGAGENMELVPIQPDVNSSYVECQNVSRSTWCPETHKGFFGCYIAIPARFDKRQDTFQKLYGTNR